MRAKENKGVGGGEGGRRELIWRKRNMRYIFPVEKMILYIYI
jgi:hypothetical protein